jgi:Holliday junction resolvase RusA-like endonuclease
MTRADAWKKRKVVLEYWRFKDEVRAAGLILSDSPVLVFEIPMPESWSKKKRAGLLGKPHKQKPDIDNLVKAVFDSVFEDDAHIWRVSAIKIWAERGAILCGSDDS